MKKLKTINKVKIVLAIVCTIVAVILCIAVLNEWEAQGCNMPFSKWAGCIVYIVGSIGLYIGCVQFADWIDYWFFNGDEYYRGGLK